MTCQEARSLLSSYLDRELGSTAQTQVSRHIEACPRCQQELELLTQLSGALKSIPRRQAPEALRQRVEASLEKRKPAPKVMGLFGAFAGGVAATLAVVALLSQRAKSTDSVLGNEIIGSHVAALMSNHLLDVVSTDRHTVKPWFVGKVAISPTPWDLKSEGFPLIGGRLGNIGGQPIPVFVYRRRKHFIDIYVLPHPSAASWSESKQGYHVLAWSQQQLEFIAVSDVDASDLATLRDDYLRNSQ